MGSTGFLPLEGVQAHQVSQLQKILDPAGTFQFVVETVTVSGDDPVLLKLRLQFGDLLPSLLQSGSASGDPYMGQQDAAKLGVGLAGTEVTFPTQELANIFLTLSATF